MGVLRFLLAISVLVAHSPAGNIFSPFFNDYLAVKGFFIVSGFYMAIILNKKYLGNNVYWVFISNRFIRLYPAYIACIIVKIGLSSLALFMNYSHLHISSISNLIDYSDQFSFLMIIYLCFSNLLILGTNLAVLINVPYVSLNAYPFLLLGPSWSIDFEMMFYIIVPFFARKNTIILFGLFILSFTVYILSNLVLNLQIASDLTAAKYSIWNRDYFPSELWLFILGMISYKFYSIVLDVTENPTWIRVAIYKSIAFCGILFLIYNKIFESYINKFFFRLSFYLPMSIHDFFVLFAIATIIPFLFYASNKSMIDKWIGDLSYPLYLIHLPILYALPLFFRILPENFETFYTEIAIMISITFSILFVKYVENKVDAYRQIRIVTLLHAKPFPQLYFRQYWLFLLAIPLLIFGCLLILAEILIVFPYIREFLSSLT